MTTPITDLDSVLPENANDLVEAQVEDVFNRLWTSDNRRDSPTVTLDRASYETALAVHSEAVDECQRAQRTRDKRFRNSWMASACFASAASLIATAAFLIDGDLGTDWEQRVAGFSILPTLYASTGTWFHVKSALLRKRIPERPAPNCMFVGYKAAAAYRHLAAAVDEAVEMDDVSGDVLGHLHAARAQADEYLPLIEASSEDEQYTGIHTEDLVRTAAEVLVTVGLIKHAAREREEMLGAGRMAPPSLAAAREAVLGEIKAIREVSATDSSTNRALPHTTDS